MTRGSSQFVGHGERRAESTVQERANIGVETVEKCIAMVVPGIILACQRERGVGGGWEREREREREERGGVREW